MAKFNPRRVEPIEYDFGADPIPMFDGTTDSFVEGELANAKGVVPEPTGEQLDELLAEVDRINVDAQAGNLGGHRGSRDRITAAFSQYLGIPVEHLHQLPPRHFAEFRDFVVGALVDG